jgi:hypothetical protein
MFGPRRPIRPDELDADEGQVPEALAMGRALEEWADRESATAGGEFADRVMAAVATEPEPRPAAIAMTALAHGQLRRFLGAVGDAWQVATGTGRPLAARAPAVALVLLVAIVTASIGGMATVGALNLLTPDAVPSPSPIVSPSPSPSAPASPSQPTSPSPSPTATPSPQATPTDDGTAEPTDEETLEPTETPDGNDNSGPGGGGGSGGDDSGGNGSEP